jgi:hypothetical protein
VSTHRMPGRPVLFLSFLSLLALPAFAAGAQATLLGVAVASEVTDDDDGLTVLTDLHAVIDEPELPAVHSFWVYTRWTGKGRHQVEIEIVNAATGDVIANASDGIELTAGDPVTFATHDFTDTSFESPGEYTVDVWLDGNLARQTTLYVNAEGSYPRSPQLILSVPAVDGSVSDEGEAEITGVFEYFTFKRFPDTDDFAIVTAWFSGDGKRHRETVRIRDPRGAVIAASEAQSFTAEEGQMAVVSCPFDKVGFKAQGAYSAEVSLDGKIAAQYPLFAVRGKESQSATGRYLPPPPHDITLSLMEAHRP